MTGTPSDPAQQVFTVEAVNGFLVGISAALLDLHRVLIDAGHQTAEEAAARLDLHIAEYVRDTRHPTAVQFLRGLQLSLLQPATGLADLAGQAPEGQAD